MSMLDSLVEGIEVQKPIIGLDGPCGIGKTSFFGGWLKADGTTIAGAPSPLIVQIERGAQKCPCKKTPEIKDWMTLINLMGDIYRADKLPFETIVFDTLDAMERLIWQQVLQMEPDPKKRTMVLALGGYGKAYTIAKEDFWTLFMNGVRQIRDKHNVTIGLIAHSSTREVTSSTSESYLRTEPKLYKSSNGNVDVADYIVGLCDAWGSVYLESIVKKTQAEDFTAIATGNRMVKWAPSPSHSTKNRFNITNDLPLSWESFNQFAKI